MKIANTKNKHEKRDGAVVACWAHNPKVGGSNPSPVNHIFFQQTLSNLNLNQRSVDRSHPGACPCSSVGRALVETKENSKMVV